MSAQSIAWPQLATQDGCSISMSTSRETPTPIEHQFQGGYNYPPQHEDDPWYGSFLDESSWTDLYSIVITDTEKWKFIGARYEYKEPYKYDDYQYPNLSQNYRIEELAEINDRRWNRNGHTITSNFGTTVTLSSRPAISNFSYHQKSYREAGGGAEIDHPPMTYNETNSSRTISRFIFIFATDSIIANSNNVILCTGQANSIIHINKNMAEWSYWVDRAGFETYSRTIQL